MELGSFAGRWAAALVRWRVRITLVAIAVTALALGYAAGLPVRGDFARLLPPSAPSVRDLATVAARVPAQGAVYVVVRSADPRARARAAARVATGARALPPTLVTAVVTDEAAARQFAWDHRWHYVPLDELRRARDALADRIARATARANPLYVELDDEADDGASDDARARSAADALRTRLRDARARRDDPGALVSTDGRVQVIALRAPTSAGDSSTGRALIAAAEALAAGAAAPGVELGVTGDLVVGLHEHDSILAGVVLATALTAGLVLLGMLAYYRSARTVAAIAWSLTAGTAIAFAGARAAIGELNLATAFLSSIVVGNGINVGIVVAARWREALAAGARGADALAIAIAGTVRGTATASLAAALAYAALGVTEFRGFRHFGAIGAAGMATCWLSAYTVLPAALALIEPGASRRPAPGRRLGRAMARLVPRSGSAVAIVIAVDLVALVAVGAWLRAGPYETDLRRLRATNRELGATTAWQREVDRAIGKGRDGGVVFALADARDTAALVARLRAARDATGGPLLARVRALDDLLPTDGAARAALLAELRALLARARDVDAVRADELADVTPPTTLAPIDLGTLPAELAWPFTERDGTRGRLILAAPGAATDPWRADDLVRFAGQVRAIARPADTAIGGGAFVMADLLDAIERDGPRATLAALLGAALVVVLVLGRGRGAWITLASGASGALTMVALGASLGARINFLDFAALPITLGVGIDYAANLVARARADGDVGRAITSIGGAVALCSFTTVVGYGALLVSDSGAIRSFGLAAILGELTCLGFALVTVGFAHVGAARPALPDRPLGSDARGRYSDEDVEMG